MHSTDTMWHPAGEARRYEAAGSRTSFCERWNPAQAHNVTVHKQNSDVLSDMIDALIEDGKVRYLDGFDVLNGHKQ